MTAHSLVCANWDTSGYGGMIQVRAITCASELRPGIRLHLCPMLRRILSLPISSPLLSPASLQTPITHPGIICAASPFLSGRYGKDIVSRFDRWAVLICITRDRGYGRVSIDGRGEPVVHYRLSDYDRNNLVVRGEGRGGEERRGQDTLP